MIQKQVYVGRNHFLQMSQVTRKPVFGVSVQDSLLSYRDRQSLEILDLASIGISIDIILSK